MRGSVHGRSLAGFQRWTVDFFDPSTNESFQASLDFAFDAPVSQRWAVVTLDSFGPLVMSFEGETWAPILPPVLASDGVLYTMARRAVDPSIRVFARTLDGPTRALPVLDLPPISFATCG